MKKLLELSQAGTEMNLILRLFKEVAPRVSEIVALPVDCLFQSEEDYKIRIPKIKTKEREAIISKDLYEELSIRQSTRKVYETLGHINIKRVKNSYLTCQTVY